MNPRVVAVWLLVCLLWSSTFAFIRLGLQDITPFTFAWLRLAIAAAVLVPKAIGGGHWRSLSGRDVAAVCGTGVLLLGVNYGLVFWGAQFWLNYCLLQRMDASAMLMMGVAEVPIAVALGAMMFDQRLPAGTLLGGTCVMVGVIAGLTARPVTPRADLRPCDRGKLS